MAAFVVVWATACPRRVIAGMRVLGLALAVLGPSVAMASASAEAPGESEAERVVAIAADAWPEAEEAIAFELRQAGFTIEKGSSMRVTIERDETSWRANVHNGAPDPLVSVWGDATDTPDTVALRVVEAVEAAAARPVLEGVTEPESEPTMMLPPVEPSLPVEPTITETALEEAGPGARPGWGVDVSLAGANLGWYGASVGARYRWTRAEVGAEVAGASLGSHEEVWNDGGEGWTGGVVRIQVAGGMAFRPGRRFRPSVGLGSMFLVPVIRSHYAGTTETGGTVNSNGVSAGLMWVPAPEVGFRVQLHPTTALMVAARGGPTVALQPAPLEGGDTFDAPRWFFGGNLGLLFGKA